MKELTKEKPCHVKIVEEPLAILVLYKIMKGLTPKNKCMNIWNVGEPFLDISASTVCSPPTKAGAYCCGITLHNFISMACGK
ncbi:hypothetical protein QTO34_015494 [Cnephaeus nilssonii]|uniref:Uncharacterized protein n=1 Tax=Cnephaeus nilssonii TaxID=3371016 RepID=A0AA40I478_CNENI|nr:hypothetical protein QTO34_015494 [Eptesicus nilssonii]